MIIALFYNMFMQNSLYRKADLKDLDKLISLKDEVKKEIKTGYDINIQGSYDLLDETIKKLEVEKDPQMIVKYELMIAKMYTNKGDDVKAKEYMDRFLKDNN